jgi:hypothetical protein
MKEQSIVSGQCLAPEGESFAPFRSDDDEAERQFQLRVKHGREPIMGQSPG